MPNTSTQTRTHSRAGFFIVFFWLALHPAALLAGPLQGRLLDQDAGRPVSGAVLTLSAPSGAVHSVRSDTSGSFRLENLATGTWDLRVERLGYRPLQGHIQIGAAPTSVELHLQSLPMIMDELVVRARRSPEGKHIASFVETIVLGNRRTPGADLAQTLDRATGVNIRRYGGLGSFSTLSIRGSTAEQVQVFLDGVPLNSAVGGGVDLGGLPIGGVESVDIYRGAVPARFGGNSLGGVVHIRTQPLGGKVRTRLHTASGSYGTRQLGASLSGPYKGWEYLGLVNYRASRNDFRFWDDNGTEYNSQDDGWARRLNSDFRGLRGLAKIGCSLGASRLQIHNTFDLSYKGIPGIGNNQSLHTRYDTWRHIAEAALFGPLGHGRAGYRLKAHHSREKDEYRDRHGEVGLGRQHDRNITQSLGLRGEVNALLSGESLLTAFVAARRETFAPDDLLRPESRLLRSRRRALAVGTEVEVPLGQRLTLNAGTQAEGLDDRFFDRKYFAPSAVLPSRENREILWGYHMGAALDLGAGLALKTHNGRYQRAPNFFELFGDRGAVIGNTNLVSEQGHNWDLGLVFRGPVDGMGLGLAEVVCYHNRVEDLIRFMQNSQRVSRPYNMGRALLRGVETRVEARLLPRLALRGNYAYQRAENRTPFSFERGNDLPNAPRHRLNARVSLDLGRAEIYGEFSRESRHFLDRANLRTVPVRALYNLGGSVPLTEGIALSWDLRNLTDNQVADLWGYPLPGRSYGLSVRYAAHQ
ncbi:MAG: TonB-dependent receptor [Gemmatimonadota bacterium]|nr:TonB-dependent receptor [Gemmatimonadota bacterium]